MISLDQLKDCNKFKFFSGLTLKEFEALRNFVGGEKVVRYMTLKYNDKTPQYIKDSKLSSKNRLLMFLIRLRRGVPLEDLAWCFDVSRGYAGDICYAITRLLYETFKALEEKVFISADKQNKKKPMVMKPFTNLRVILDGASFKIESPSNMQMHSNNHSSYKSHPVMLFAIGVSCHGSTIFCSKGFEGHMSDKESVLKSTQLQNMLKRGDSIMTDRGYEITSEMLRLGVHVYKPPPKSDHGQMNPEQEILTRAIAAARIYVEHAIADIKDNRLLQGTIPLTLQPVLAQLVFMRNFSTKKIFNKKVVVRESHVNEE